MSDHDAPKNIVFNPNHLFDAISERMHLKNDAALSHLLKLRQPVINKIRHGQMPVGASLLLRMHEETNISVGELRELMGDRRKKYRMNVSLVPPALPGKQSY